MGDEEATDVKTGRMVFQVDFIERVSFIGVDVCLLEDRGKLDGNIEAGWG